MNLELFVPLHLKAEHSLEEVEAPHGHLWRIRVGVRGPLVDGRVASLPQLISVLERALTPFQGVYLNEHPDLDEATRKNPTCENLCHFLFRRFDGVLRSELSSSAPGVQLSSIEVFVDELDGRQTGSARLS